MNERSLPLGALALGAVLLSGCRSGNADRSPPAPTATAPPGPAMWSRAFRAEGKGSARILAVARGAGDEVIVAGALSGTVDLGGGPLAGRGVSSAFVAKYDGAGRHVWSKRFPGEGAQVVTAVAVDGAGDVVVTGTLDQWADFGGGPLRSEGQIDVFVVSLDPAGNHRWSRRFGDDEEQEAGSVAVAPDGSVILAGSFEGGIDLGGGRLASAGGDDVFLARLDASGKHVWSKRFGNVHAQHGRAIAVDPAGNVVLAGDTQGSFDLGGRACTAGDDATSLLLARFDPRGAVLAASCFPASPRSLARPYAAAIDGSGGVFVAGALRGSVDLGAGPLKSAGEAVPDAFLARLDAALEPAWSKRFGDAASQEATGLSVDAAGAPVVTGRFEGIVDFGGGALVSAGRDDVFLARFDSGGAHQESLRFGDPDRQEGTGVALDPAGNAVIVGSLQGSVDFGAGPLAGPAGFVAKIRRPAPR